MDGSPVLSLHAIDAVIFDMDGVVTDTAATHAAAWKRLFDGYLAERSRPTGEPFRVFDADVDYRRFVDGKPRYDGVRSFLASRDIALPEGEPADPADRETVCGLGNRKDGYFRDSLRDGGARAFPSTLELVRELQARGVRTAIISSSRNMAEVLSSAGVDGLFEVRVDGVVADELRLRGKPDPAMFLEASRRLGVEPARAVVVEDALAGVEAGRRGGFGLVVGVDRTGDSDALREAGADVVVEDLGDLRIDEGSDLRRLPSALDRLDEIVSLLRAGRPAVFLDYDGTLTPIVRHPSEAVIDEDTRRAVRELAEACPVAMISGRDLDDVREMVAVDGISYAGSHGFDILASDGSRHRRGSEYTEPLAAAATELEAAVRDVPGAWVERKRFAVTVHVREVEDRLTPQVEAAVRSVAERHATLRQTGGKRILELRPAIDWDKGKALLSLLEVLGLAGEDIVPVYLGDDETDEDAFAAIQERGVGVVVRGEGDDRPTSARYALSSPDEVRRFLAALAAAIREAP